MPRVDSESLQSFARDLAEALGAPPEIAEALATSLVSADLRGHGSHGVIRFASTYRTMIEGGQLDPAATPRVVSEDGPTGLVDGERGFGQVAGRLAADVLIERTEATGVGIVGLGNASHLGRVGEFAEQVAEEGLLFAAWVNTGGTASLVAPVGGLDRRLATNPIAFGVPSFGAVDFPIVLDMATSQVAHGKITKRAVEGKDLPPSWAIDDGGEALTDPEDFEDGTGAMAPLGGSVAGHKGFGLAVVAELFAGICGDGRVAGERSPEWVNNAATFLAIDPARFGAEPRHRERVAALLAYLRDADFSEELLPESARGEELLVPGEAEHRTMADREERGIPIDDRTLELLSELAAAYDVSVPLALDS
ncbi:hypothetical protein BRC86_05545 [Halobacteriales archaeon QS_3_64_16]|nr:MAG: hypothetical protein BRC86_05545 [Halobacteriales archaeon QS_3_64_16]